MNEFENTIAHSIPVRDNGLLFKPDAYISPRIYEVLRTSYPYSVEKTYIDSLLGTNAGQDPHYTRVTKKRLPDNWRVYTLSRFERLILLPTVPDTTSFLLPEVEGLLNDLLPVSKSKTVEKEQFRQEVLKACIVEPEQTKRNTHLNFLFSPTELLVFLQLAENQYKRNMYATPIGEIQRLTKKANLANPSLENIHQYSTRMNKSLEDHNISLQVWVKKGYMGMRYGES